MASHFCLYSGKERFYRQMSGFISNPGDYKDGNPYAGYSDRNAALDLI
jgi:hypothetical protein